MKGTVRKIEQDWRRDNYVSGVIWGEDGYEYRFKLPKGDVSFNEDDEVLFDEKDTGGDFTQAINIRPATNTSENTPDSQSTPIAATAQAVNASENTTTVPYYNPGVAKYLTDPNEMKSICEKHLTSNSKEDKVIERLKEVLYIATINHQYMGNNSFYPFCIIGTTQHLKRFIHDRSEFLLVFSYFRNKSWQQSTNQAALRIRRRRDVAVRRPCVNFYMLVSNALDLIDQINKMKGGTEAAIIPFSFEEILSTQSQAELINLINSRFEEYYYENNMLNEEGPIGDDSLLFGDRGKIADAIVARCKEGKYSGIFGLRRSGKSSVLRAVERRLMSESIKFTHVESRSGLENVHWKVALYNIAMDIRIATTGAAQGEMTRDEFEKSLKLNSTREDYNREATSRFVEDVKYYTKDEQLFVIAIDEIELITYNTASSSDWKSLEAYKAFWGALRDCGCPLIVCGVNSTINEKSRIIVGDNACDNPMYERIHLIDNATHTYLPPFTDEQTKEMINTLGGFSNISFSKVYAEINHAFGGQPFPIRKFCSFIYDKVKDLRKPGVLYEVSMPTYQACLDDFNRSSNGIELYNTILEHIEIYKNEYRLLVKLAHAPAQYRDITREDITEIDHLQKYGLIEYDSTTELVSFRIKSLQEYICSISDKDPEDMDNKERRRFVQDGVEIIEKQLKEHIRRYYKITGQARGISVLKTAMRKHSDIIHGQRGVDVNALSFDEFFDIHKVQFYFSAIRSIISDNWSQLGSSIQAEGINQERFNTYMFDMNAGRTDADHYTAESMNDLGDNKWEIDDLTMTRFTTAYGELAAMLKKIM